MAAVLPALRAPRKASKATESVEGGDLFGGRRRSVALALALVALTLSPAGYAADGRSHPGDRRVIAWAGREFSNQAEFERYLEMRGTADYDKWALRHPNAAAKLLGVTPKARDERYLGLEPTAVVIVAAAALAALLLEAIAAAAPLLAARSVAARPLALRRLEIALLGLGLPVAACVAVFALS